MATRLPMPRFLFALAVAATAGTLAGCDAATDDTFTEQVVAQAILFGNEPLPPVRLTRTVPISVPYTDETAAIRDAAVRVHLLAENGEPEATWAFEHVADDPGVYLPADFAPPTVLPGRRYRLEADVPGHGAVRAETLLPGDFDIVDAPPDTVVYQSFPPPTTVVTPSAYPGRQTVFQFSVVAEDTTFGLTPFVADIVAQQDDAEERAELRDELIQGASPLLFEANYEVRPDGNVEIVAPWFFAAYYGPSAFTINVYDDVLYDFLRTLQVQQGGTTLSPGEIPNVRDRVENGTGFFGGAVRRTFRLFVRPR